jgi:hypothetical protein
MQLLPSLELLPPLTREGEHECSRCPAFEKKSIGVISLIGTAQAKLIYGRIVSDLGADVVEKHRIMCGGSATC